MRPSSCRSSFVDTFPCFPRETLINSRPTARRTPANPSPDLRKCYRFDIIFPGQSDETGGMPWTDRPPSPTSRRHRGGARPSARRSWGPGRGRALGGAGRRGRALLLSRQARPQAHRGREDAAHVLPAAVVRPLRRGRRGRDLRLEGVLQVHGRRVRASETRSPTPPRC